MHSDASGQTSDKLAKYVGIETLDMLIAYIGTDIDMHNNASG
jgi:hypothetical protein